LTDCGKSSQSVTVEVDPNMITKWKKQTADGMVDSHGSSSIARQCQFWWRLLKYECVYLNAFKTGSQAELGLTVGSNTITLSGLTGRLVALALAGAVAAWA